MAKEPEPIRITTATRSHRDDIARRQKRYLISMGIRTACFVAAIVSIGHWFVWLFLVGSFILPYVAVVMANAVDTKSDGFQLRDGSSQDRQLPGGTDSE